MGTTNINPSDLHSLLSKYQKLDKTDLKQLTQAERKTLRAVIGLLKENKLPDPEKFELLSHRITQDGAVVKRSNPPRATGILKKIERFLANIFKGRISSRELKQNLDSIKEKLEKPSNTPRFEEKHEPAPQETRPTKTAVYHYREDELPPTLLNFLPGENRIETDKWLNNALLTYYIRDYLGKRDPNLLIPLEDMKTCMLRKPDNSEEADHVMLMDQIKKDLSREEAKNKKIFAYPLLVSGNHWTLVLIDREKRTLEYYDSKMNHGDSNLIKNSLSGIVDMLSSQDKEKSYNLEYKIKQNLQPMEISNCGPWMLYFLEERLKDPNVNFNELDPSTSTKMIEEHRYTLIQNILPDDLKKYPETKNRVHHYTEDEVFLGFAAFLGGEERHQHQKWMAKGDLLVYIDYLCERHPELLTLPHSMKNCILSIPTDQGRPEDFVFLKDQIKNDLSRADAQDKKILAYPLLIEGHFTLVLIDREKRALEFYDSKLDWGEDAAFIKNSLTEVVNMPSLRGEGEAYTLDYKIKQRLQATGADTHNCGPWILYFLEERLKDPSVDFNKLDLSTSGKMIEEHRDTLIHNLLPDSMKK